jgi:hypothetical protein
MVEKIHRFGHAHCGEVLGHMRRELSVRRSQFLNAEWTQTFERDWMERYVLA